MTIRILHTAEEVRQAKANARLAWIDTVQAWIGAKPEGYALCSKQVLEAWWPL